MTEPRKVFGKRNLPEVNPPPPVMTAPGGLGDESPLSPRRLRSTAVVISAAGLIALAGYWLATKKSCKEEDWSGETCRSSSGHGGGAHFGFFRHWGSSGGATSSGPHGASFGGFGSTGASGVHGGWGGA
jgi:hypothetical protein